MEAQEIIQATYNKFLRGVNRNRRLVGKKATRKIVAVAIDNDLDYTDWVYRVCRGYYSTYKRIPALGALASPVSIKYYKLDVEREKAETVRPNYGENDELYKLFGF